MDVRLVTVDERHRRIVRRSSPFLYSHSDRPVLEAVANAINRLADETGTGLFTYVEKVPAAG